MPTYEYKCKECEHLFEHFQTMSSDRLTDCPECKQPSLRRLIGSGGALIFKGSGFYCTDYKQPSLDGKVERTKEAAKRVKEDAAAKAPAPASSAPSASTSGSSSGGD